MPVGVHPGGDQGVHVDHPPVLADLHRQRVDPAERVRPGVQRPGTERRYLRVEVAGHLADLRTGQRLDPQLLGQPFHPPGRDAQQIGGGDHGDQGLLGTAAMCQQPVREERALAQLGHRQLHGAGTGVPLPGAVAVALVGPLGAAFAIVGAADLVGLGGHHRVRQRCDHLPQHVRGRLGQVLLQQRGRVDSVRCGHRGDPFQSSLVGTRERSRGGRLTSRRHAAHRRRARTPPLRTQPGLLGMVQIILLPGWFAWGHDVHRRRPERR